MARILLVEDDVSLSKLVADWLAYEHYDIEQAYNGREALTKLEQQTYDLVILDVELPELSGLEVLAQFRERGGLAMVLMLTMMDGIDDKLSGFSGGADDYMTKPFDPKELSARVRAMLRRPPLLYTVSLKVGNVEFNPETRVTNVGDARIELDPIESAILEFFMRNTNQVFKAEELIEKAWPIGSNVSKVAVASCLSRLRQKLGAREGAVVIRTIYGGGYCMDNV